MDLGFALVVIALLVLDSVSYIRSFCGLCMHVAGGCCV